MTQHGFARDSRFAWVERSENRCVLVLEDSAATGALLVPPYQGATINKNRGESGPGDVGPSRQLGPITTSA
jgi:hypothetical protein